MDTLDTLDTLATFLSSIFIKVVDNIRILFYTFFIMSLLTKHTQAIKAIKHKPKQLKSNKSNSLIDSMRFSIRISPKRVSSVSLKKNIVSLWLLMTSTFDSNDAQVTTDHHKLQITDFIYNTLDTWKEETAKGFSDYVTEKMIEDILEASDFIEYKNIKEKLGNL